jgi:hypothetical protein
MIAVWALRSWIVAVASVRLLPMASVL